MFVTLSTGGAGSSNKGWAISHLLSLSLNKYRCLNIWLEHDFEHDKHYPMKQMQSVME